MPPHALSYYVRGRHGTAWQCGCGVVGKPLFYHAGNPGSISRAIPTDLPTSSRHNPSEIGKWIPDNTGANSESSSTMRVAPINHDRWYDRQPRTYDPGSVGGTVVQYQFPREISSPSQMRMRPANFQAISLIWLSPLLIRNIKNGSWT